MTEIQQETDGRLRDPDPQPPPELASPIPQTQEAIALSEIVEVNRVCSRLEDLKCDAEARAKAAKKRWEAAVEDLQSLIRKQDEHLPLFDGAEKPAETSPDDESWRDVDLDILTEHGLSEAIVEKFEHFGLNTIGELADHTTKGGTLTDIDGIGPAKAEAIEKALQGFWAAWNGKHRHPVDPAAISTPEESAQVADRLAAIDAEANGEPESPEFLDLTQIKPKRGGKAKT